MSDAAEPQGVPAATVPTTAPAVIDTTATETTVPAPQPAPAPTTAVATTAERPREQAPEAYPDDGAGAALARANEDPFEARNMRQLVWLSEKLSKSNLVAKDLRGKPADVLLVLMNGHDLGLTISQSLRCIDAFDGKVSLPARLIVGLIRKSGLCETWRLVESTDKVATYETLRKGDIVPITMSYTIEQAGRARLLTKDNWSKDPTTMLRRRCQTAIGREVYPEITLGLYDPDELDEVRERLDADPRTREVADSHIRRLLVDQPDPLRARLEERAAARAKEAPADPNAPDGPPCAVCKNPTDPKLLKKTRRGPCCPACVDV